MKYNIALVIIATGKYDQFIDPLLASSRKYFLIQDNVTFYIFTDKIKYYGDDCVCIPTKHEPWPGPTLHRYRNIIASKNLFAGMDYIFYCDVDMLFVDHVGREILGDGLTATHHPGFYSFGTGSWGKDQRSTAYTPNGKRYYAGGFQGGMASIYLNAVERMANNIAVDHSKDVIAEWHDETHWNKLLSETPNFIALDPSYCMVEQMELRVKWKIGHLKPKLLALAKDHKTIRS